MNTPLRLTAAEVSSKPFPYFVSPEALQPDTSQSILAWLETDVPWQLVKTDFYEQFEFSLWDVLLPRGLNFLRSPFFLTSIKKRLEEVFEVGLKDHPDITAHKLIPGQRIRLHNDFIPGAETHRLLIQLNNGWQDENGGLLLFFHSDDPADIHKIFRPQHNSAVGFALTQNSYHAVSTIHAGTRFTLVYSFIESGGDG